MKKATRATGMRRKIVEQLYYECNPPRKIYEMLKGKYGDVGYAQIRKDVCWVRKRWGDNLKTTSVGDYAPEYYHRSLHLANLAIKSEDYAVAYKIIKDIAVLLGVDLTEKKAIEFSNKPLSKLNTENELNAELQNLMAIIEAGGEE